MIMAMTLQMAQGIGETQMRSEVGMQNLNTTKVRLETTSISFVSHAFLHVVSNAIDSNPIVQVIEWPSFKFH
jgi:hypothetical protein